MNGTIFPAWLHGAVLMTLAYFMVQLGRGQLVMPSEMQRKFIESLPLLKSKLACFSLAAIFAIVGAGNFAWHFGLR